jgi:hypothetical protein
MTAKTYQPICDFIIECILCKSNDTHDFDAKVEIKTKGQNKFVNLWTRKCNTCDTEFLPKDLKIKNAKIIKKLTSI